MSGIEITRRDARVAALSDLIDYAGLFPPASLDMAGAVAGYRAARSGATAWIVDRFICPASRLEELLGVLSSSMGKGEPPWPLVVTASSRWIDSLAEDAGAVRTFTEAARSAASVEVVEISVPPGVAANETALAADAAAVLRAFAAVVFFELPWEPDPSSAMGVLARVRLDAGRALGVKLRCGGAEADAFPPVGAAALFLHSAAERDLPLKATAGLHHPFRHVAADTGFAHHGFVNLLTAAALAHEGVSRDVLAEVIGDEDPASFDIRRSGIAWGEHRVAESVLLEMRNGLLVGYGSCSFDEPIDDLTRLGVLPVEPA